MIWLVGGWLVMLFGAGLLGLEPTRRSRGLLIILCLAVGGLLMGIGVGQ